MSRLVALLLLSACGQTHQVPEDGGYGADVECASSRTVCDDLLESWERVDEMTMGAIWCDDWLSCRCGIECRLIVVPHGDRQVLLDRTDVECGCDAWRED